jgi:hypothetical protein
LRRSSTYLFAVTVSGLQVLSTTWKSAGGTASHWKYIIDNVNVYRGTENPHRLPAIADLVSDDISSQYGLRREVYQSRCGSR